jgi:hypothetical protein
MVLVFRRELLQRFNKNNFFFIDREDIDNRIVRDRDH